MCKRLHLDFNLHTAGKLQLHQGIDGLGVAAVDVYQTLVGGNLELLTGLLVNEGRTVHSDDALAGGKGYRTTDDGTGSLHGLNDFLGGFVHEIVIVRFEFDANFLAHIVVLFYFLFEKVYAALAFGEYLSLIHISEPTRPY